MRPYLVLTAVVFALVLTTAAAFGQQPFPYSGGCFYGCGPYVPRLTTPEISLQQFSPNPVGASNATTGLIAGATNSTLSQVNGSTSSVWTVPVWYEGGDAPLITPGVNLWPERVGREGHPMHEAMREERPRLEGPREERPREARTREGRPHEERAREEHGARPAEEAPVYWTYFTRTTQAANAATAEGGTNKAGRVYNNDDVKRQNDKNGMVKYDDKTEKI